MYAKTASLYRVDTQDCLFDFLHVCKLVAATFSPTGTTVLSAAGMNEVRLWCVSSGECVRVMDIEGYGDITPAFNHGDPVVLQTGEHGGIAVWNVRTGHQVWRHEVGCISGPGTADFSSCGDRFFTLHGGPDGSCAHAVDVWAVAGCSHNRRLETASPRTIKYAVFSSDGWRVLAVSCCHEITVWSLRHDFATYTIKDDSEFHMVDFSPDGVHVMTSCFGRVCLWTADAAKSRFCFPQRGVQEAVFTPDGKIMLLGGPGGIAMWSAAGALCWANADKEMWGVFFSTSKCGHKFWHDAEQDRHNG